MESSFLEDFLKREVDENQVNALVGTLENALGSSRTTVAPTGNSVNVSAGKLISVGQIVSQCASSKSVAANSVSKAIPTTIHTLSAVTTSSPNTTIKANGTDHNKNKNVVINAISNTTSNVAATSIPQPRTTVVIHRQTPSPGLSAAAIISNGGSPRVSIAPKTTIPIAPRLGTNIVITPRQAQILMAQQRFANPLLRSNLIARMPGAIPVIPRIHGPTGAIAVPPVMNTQIPGLGTLPRAIMNMTGTKHDPRIMQLNVPLNTTASLTQIKQTPNTIPGQINYRFRQVNPLIAQPATVNGVTTSSASTNSTANITMMKESVKRLKEFFSNLINLACGPNQPPEIGRMVKELVHNLMQGRVSEEEFIEKLQKTLKSDPQPNLVHFLKKTLPHLRETIKKQQMHQVASKAQPPHSSVPAASINIAANRVRPNLPSVTAPIRTTIMGQSYTTPQGVLRKNLSIPEQMFQKQLLQGRIISSSGHITPGMNTLIHTQQRGTAIAANIKGVAGKQILMGNQAANTHKEKQKSTAYYSSASGADDDINDVTCMAGVNLMEESQKILSTGDFMSYQTRSIKDKPILLMENLKSYAEKIAKKSGISDISPDVLTVISHAAEQQLRTVLERLTACSLHRNDPHKDEIRYETISDVRNQLRVFEEIDEVERKHRESREREILMRVAKSRSRTEDPEQARLKEKAKQMQLEEEEQNRKRAANRTALEAIGGPRKKRKLDEALESLQNAQTPGNNNTSSASLSSSNTSVNQNIRARQHRITIRDINLVLETEKYSTKSLLLYRSLLR